MWCSVNPAIREPDLDTVASFPATAGGDEPGRHVVVVGGGVAGAEAAYRAAAAGARVTLFERLSHLGGRARIAGSRRGRERWGLYLSWLDDQLVATGVDVRRGTEATLDEEGGFIAPTAAEALVTAGWTVRVATALPAVATRVDPTQVYFVRRRLKLAGVELLNQVSFEHDAEGWSFVDVESDIRSPAGPVDLVVVAGTRRSLDVLSGELQRRRPQLLVTRVGDALAPRSLLDAVAEGARAGRTLLAQPVGLTPATASAHSDH